METAALTVRCTSRWLAASAPAHGYRQRAAATLLNRRRRLALYGPLRALPEELSEILKPSQMVPGSPADTGDVSSLIPVSALLVVLYLFTNWVVPELVMKQLRPTAEEEAAASASSMSSTKVKKKKKKSRKETMKV